MGRLRQTQGSNNQALSFGRSRARVFTGDKPTVTFEDVAGCDEAKLELEEVLEFLKEPQKFAALGARIPKGDLVEVRFADLEREPLATVRRIYEALDLPGFDAAWPEFQRYVDTQRAYRKNEFRLSAGVRRRVARRWAFAFEAFGYPVALPATRQTVPASEK